MKNYIRLIIISLLLPFVSGCLEDPEYSIVRVITSDEVEFTKSGIVLKGEIDTENFLRASIESQGFCYSTKKEPTLSDSIIVLNKPMWGEYSAILSNLNEGTKYYVRAFAQNKYGVVYGEEISFTSLTRPKVSTIEVSENDNHELIVSCELLSTGTGEVELLGVCYSITNSEPTLEKDSVKEVSTIKQGKYEITYPIKANTRYYVRAVGQNIAGVAYGSVKEIITKKQTYTITFDSNDGTSKSSSLKVNSMETNILPENKFVREGYTFIGWNTKADGSGVVYSDKQSITLNKNITLYAQWRQNSHKIIFKGNGASGNMPSVEIKYNNSYTIPSCSFTYTGNTFMGWNTSTDGSGTTYSAEQTITIKGDLTLYAQWEKKSYTITFYSNGGTGSMKNVDVKYLETYELPTNLYTRTGYKFIGWNTLSSGNGTSYSENQKIAITENLQLYAQWKKVYTVTFYSNGGTGSMSVLNVTSLEKFKLPTNSFVREGYTFINWNTDSDGKGVSYENNEELTIAGNLTLYAQWGEKPYTITYNSNGGSGSMQSEQKKYQDTYTLQSNKFTNTGHTFAGWNTKSDGSGTTYSENQTITIKSDLTLYAQWEKITYTISFYANGGTGTMQNEKVKYLESYSLPSNKFTRTGYVFVGWNTMYDGSGKSYSNGQSVTLSANLSLYAIWEKQTLPVVTTSSVSNISTNSVTCGGTVTSSDYTIIERGICYATHSNPTISSNTWYSSSSTATFNCTISGLTGNTTYYYRAFARYSGGVEYGDIKSFKTLSLPVVTTSSVSNISTNSATCGGTIESPDYSITERGICYATTTSKPTISNSVVKSGSGTGTFICSLTGLSSGATYYVRAYAKYPGVEGVIYGETKTFTTKRTPSISSFTISNIGEISAECNAYVSSSDYTITERGFYYSTYSDPTISGYKVVSGSGVGSFSSSLSNLSRNTTYYVRAYAVYNGNTIYSSDVKSFKTYYTLKITTSEVTEITKDYVVLEGEIICSGVTISSRGFDYWTSTNPKVNTLSCGSGTGIFSVNWGYFMQNTTYYVRAFAVINGVKSYGNTQIFKTEPLEIDYPNGSKLYFINTAGWTNVYAYVWKERGISSGGSGIDLGIMSWPGKPATYEGTFRGYPIYSYDIAGLDVNSVIFSNNGGAQTEDLDIDLYKTYFYQDINYYNRGEWYGSLSEIP